MAANSYKLSKFKEEYPKIAPLLRDFVPSPFVLLVYYCSNFGDSDDFSQFLEKLSGFQLEDQLKVIFLREDERTIQKSEIETNFYKQCKEFQRNIDLLGVNDNVRAVVESILNNKLEVSVLDIDEIGTDFEKLLQIESDIPEIEFLVHGWKNAFGRVYISIYE